MPSVASGTPPKGNESRIASARAWHTTSAARCDEVLYDSLFATMAAMP